MTDTTIRLDSVERAIAESRERHERKRAEAALRASEVNMRLAVDAEPHHGDAERVRSHDGERLIPRAV